MKDTPRVSVCMITYGHEKYIREAIESILQQEIDFPIEVIIANDVSPDNTDAVVQDVLKNHPKSCLINYIKHEKNLGMKANFNFALHKCSGKYTAICEGDDYWTDPLKLQKQVDFLEKNPDYSMCFHNAQILDEISGKFSPFAELRDGVELRNGEYSGEELLKTWTVPTASVVFKTDKSSFMELSNPKYIFPDIILFLSLANAGKIWCMNEYMSVYRKHEGGETHSGFDLAKLKRFIAHHEEIAKNFGGKYKHIEKEILSKLYFELAMLHMKNFSPHMFRSLFSSFSAQPAEFMQYCLIRFQRLFKKLPV